MYQFIQILCDLVTVPFSILETLLKGCLLVYCVAPLVVFLYFVNVDKTSDFHSFYYQFSIIGRCRTEYEAS